MIIAAPESFRDRQNSAYRHRNEGRFRKRRRPSAFRLIKSGSQESRSRGEGAVADSVFFLASWFPDSIQILAPYVFKYFIPVSHMTVATAASRPSCSANRKAAMTLPPVE